MDFPLNDLKSTWFVSLLGLYETQFPLIFFREFYLNNWLSFGLLLWCGFLSNSFFELFYLFICQTLLFLGQKFFCKKSNS